MSKAIPKSQFGIFEDYLHATSYTLDYLSSRGDMYRELAVPDGLEDQGRGHCDDRQSSSIASSFVQKISSSLLHLNHYLVL